MSVNVGQRHVPFTASNTMFYAVDQARTLAVHTIKICSNEKVFDPKYSYITQQVIDTAMGIFSDAWAANNVYVNTKSDWDIRSGLQKKSIAKCYSLLGLIDISKSLFHLRSSKAAYWGKLVILARDMVRAWHEKDRKRYGHFGYNNTMKAVA